MGSGIFETDDSFAKTVFNLILHCPMSVASERPNALESRHIGILSGCKLGSKSTPYLVSFMPVLFRIPLPKA